MNNDADKSKIAQTILKTLQNPGSPKIPIGASTSVIVPSPVAAFPIPLIYYDSSTGSYWLHNGCKRFIKISKADVEKHLIALGLAQYPSKGEALSEVDEMILSIQHEHDVEIVGSLAGYAKGLVTFGDTRILVTKEPTFVKPAPGDCSLIYGVFERMFGTGPLPYLLSWIAVALDMFRKRVWRAGQALFIAGPPGAGKNLFTAILQHLFGGRLPGKPYRYMTGRVEFNSDFFGSELLTIEDEAESTDNKARRHFGAAIKMATVNQVQWMHAKGKVAVSVIPLWRLVASLNDQAERLLVIPPIEEDIADKMMIFLVKKHPMPMSTNTAGEQAAFMAALIAQLPAFVHFLDTWVIPAGLVCSRFGVRHYHDPVLVNSLKKLSPEIHLIELIDQFIFDAIFIGDAWHGRSTALSRELKNHPNRSCAREAEKLLAWTNSCGTYLSRLAEDYPDRISRRMLNGCTEWSIKRPQDPGLPPLRPKPSPELISKIVAHAGRVDPEGKVTM
ncbi:MAG: hypothetical protein JWL90_3215 [Chthoniobacteraceae bacterium]|nr:hypothetical protein [Chthoniobacteraceae bacterium]